MAVIKPSQLASGSYNITGSLHGTSSYAVTASYVVGGSGITIGSTPITSGANTRILYQLNSVITQSSNLTYDGGQVLNIGNSTTGYVKTDTDNNSGVLAGMLGTYSVNNYPLVKLTSTFTSTYADGKLSLYRGNTETVQLYASSTGGRLTGVDSVYIKAAGALSSDIALRVRNSADTENGFQYNGDGTYRLGGLGGDVYTKAFSHIADGRIFMSQTGVNFIELNPGATQHRFYFPSNGVEINTDAKPSSFAMSNSTQYTFYQGGVQYGNGIFAVSGAPTRYFLTQNGTAPSENFTDRHWYYSADQAAGNAAPHFRTENGSIIKLYAQSPVTSSQGIADALTNLGFLTGSSVIVNPSPFPYTGSADITGSLTISGSLYTSIVIPNTQTITSSASITVALGTDLIAITSQSQALTINNPTGTWPQGKDLMIRIKDNGVSQSISYDTKFRAIGVTLPTTTTANKTTYIGCIYNLSDDKFDVLGVTTEL